MQENSIGKWLNEQQLRVPLAKPGKFAKTIADLFSPLDQKYLSGLISEIRATKSGSAPESNGDDEFVAAAIQLLESLMAEEARDDSPSIDFGIWNIRPGDDLAIVHIKQLLHARERAMARVKESGRGGSWAAESIAFEHATQPFRQCTLRVVAGILDRADGFYSRYFVGTEEVCVTFEKARCRYRVARYLDWRGRRTRISWRDLNQGKMLDFQGFLSSHFLNRVSTGQDLVLHHSLSQLNPIFFYDCSRKLSEQYGFSDSKKETP